MRLERMRHVAGSPEGASPFDPEGSHWRPRRNKRGRDRRAAILAAATRQFLHDGYEAASLSQIAAEAGGSKATLYAHFRNKPHLFREAMLDTIRRVGDLDNVCLSEDGRLVDQLRDLGLRLAFQLADDDVHDLFRISVLEARRFPDVGQAFFDQFIRPITERVVELIRRGNGSGDLAAPDPVLAADQFCAMCQSQITIAYLLGAQPKPTPATLKRAIGDALRGFFQMYSA